MSAPDQQVTAIKLRAILDRIADLDDGVAEAQAPPPPEGMPVDAVALKQRAGFNLYSVAEWQSMPTQERKEAILDKRVIFLHQEEWVPTRAALLWLKHTGR